MKEGPPNDIYVMNSDGSGQTRLTTGSSNGDDSNTPTWSPDGAKIAFESSHDIYVMNADGSNEIQLTNSQSNGRLYRQNGDPAWSPDGLKIAFTSNRDGYQNPESPNTSATSHIYVMNADGTEPTRLTMEWDHPDHGRPVGGDLNPSWSANGAKIAFETQRHGNGNAEIYAINADGTGETRLTNNSKGVPPCEQWTCDDENADWSPDGAKIAFQSTRDGNLEIYVMNADGSNATRLTNHQQSDSRPAWSPDGLKIAFSSNREASYEIYIMNTDGSNVTRLTNYPEKGNMPAWGP